MRLKHFLSVFLTLLTLSVGQMWGLSSTVTIGSTNYPAQKTGSTVSGTGDLSSTWNVTVVANYFNGNDNGIHAGSNSQTATSIVLTSSSFSGKTITAVSVTGRDANSTQNNRAVFTAKVNGSAFGSTSRFTTSSDTYTATGSVVCTGNVSVEVVRSSAVTKAIYVSAVSVTFNNGGTTYTVTYNLNGGTGTTPTESAKAKDATFTLHNGTTGITAPSGKLFNKWRDQDSNDFDGGDTYTMPAKNVTLTAQWIDLPKYTIIYNAGSGSCATSTWTQTTAGQSTTLPTATPMSTCTGWSFAGWCVTSAGSADENSTSPGEILTGTYQPTSDITLYAVYTRSVNSGGSASLTKMVTGNTLSDGDKLVVVASGDYSDVAMYQETTNSSYVETWDCSTLNATTVGADSKRWWTVTATTGGFYLGDDTNGYLNMSSNNLYCSEDQSVWTLSDLEDGTFKLQSGSRNLSYRHDTQASKWRMGGTSYGNSGQTVLDLYKYSAGGGSTTYYMTSLVCCSPLGSINGSFFWSTLFEPLSPDKFRSHVLLCNHLFSSSHHRIPPHLIYTMYISRDFGFF